MASGNIRGITIELSGDTTNLESALNRVNTESKSLQSELKAVERGLKFDPGNVELVRQRQELLTQSISDTSQRLDILRNAQVQVQRQYDAGEIPVEQYRAFQRELQVTEGNLNRLQNSLNAIDGEQERLGQSTRDLQTLFDATGTSINDFSSALGTRLTNAIRDGSASADQLDRAIRIVGQNSLGASTDVDQLRRALRQIDDGGSIQEVRRELSQIANEADQAGDAVNGFGDKLSQVAGGLAAGGGIAGIISQALDVSSLDTKIDITLDVPQESRDAVRDAILGLQAYGLEGEEALEGVRRQFVLNKDATDEANAATVRYAGAIANAYSDIDFKELIQETNEISSIFGITADESLGLVNNLLRVGFPPDQLDIISEYGDQLIRAGYSAEEIQQIFAAGIDTGTYNIDQLLDGLKEGRIVLSEFGAGVDDATAELISNVGISTQQLQTWGAAVAGGGEAGKAAFEEAARAVVGIDDAVQRNAVGVALFGTLYEEQGDKITSTILNASDQVVSLDANQKALNQTVDGLDSSPAVLLSTAMTDLQTAFKPVLDSVALIIADVAKWASENVQLVAVVTGVVTVLGILLGAFVALAPAVGGLVTALPVLTAGFAAISLPITGTVAAIAGLVAGVGFLGVKLSESSIETTDWASNVSSSTAEAVGGFLDLNNQATVALNELAFSGQAVTQEMANNLIGIYAQLGDTVLAEMQADHAAQLQATTDYFANSTALTEAEEAEILANIQADNAAKELAQQEGQARIAEILTLAAEQKRAITQDEQNEINAIQQTTQENAIQYLSASQEEQRTILEALKNDASEISAQQAAEVVKNSIDQKDKVVAEAQEQYESVLAEIIRQRDDTGVISEEQAQKLIDEAKKTRDQTVESATDMHDRVVEQARLQAGEHVEQVNFETGEVKSRFEVLRDNVSKSISDTGANIKKDWSQAFEDTKKSTSDIYNEATRRFDDLKNNVGKSISDAREDISDKFNQIKNTIITTLSGIDLYGIGKNIINGLINGISSLAGKVNETVSGIVSGIKDRITNALKIKSPSRVTMGYGENIGEGLEIGIDSTRDDVFASAQRLADSVINAQSSLNGSALQSNNNQTARTVASQSNNIDMASLVAAIGDLASRPIQTAVQLNGQTIANSVSGYQYNNANITALQKGVVL